MTRRNLPRAVFAAALLAVMFCTGSAQADTDTQAQQVAANIARLAAPPVLRSAASDVEVGATGAMPVAIDSGEHEITLTLPAQGAAVDVGATTIFDGRRTDTAVAVRRTTDGAQALIAIESADAPQRYAFQVGGDVAQLRHENDGSVTALDASGDVIGSFKAPWATDATGAPVATNYHIDGHRLVQSVAHRDGGYAYPIIADPHWAESVSRCYATGQTNNIIQKLNNGAAVGGMLAAPAAGVPFAGWVASAVSAVIGGGYWILANKFTKELSQSPRRGTCMRAGFKAIDIPGFPDPRYPAIEVSSR